MEKLTSERGQLAGALDATRERLEELRKQKAMAEALAATFQSLVTRLKSMIDAGQLKVGGFGAQRAGFARQLLRQKIEPFPG